MGLICVDTRHRRLGVTRRRLNLARYYDDPRKLSEFKLSTLVESKLYDCLCRIATPHFRICFVDALLWQVVQDAQNAVCNIGDNRAPPDVFT